MAARRDRTQAYDVPTRVAHRAFPVRLPVAEAAFVEIPIRVLAGAYSILQYGGMARGGHAQREKNKMAKRPPDVAARIYRCDFYLMDTNDDGPPEHYLRKFEDRFDGRYAACSYFRGISVVPGATPLQARRARYASRTTAMGSAKSFLFAIVGLVNLQGAPNML